MPLSGKDGRSPVTPATSPSSANTPPEDMEAEMEALCRAYEERRRLAEDEECRAGCDCPDGPLSPHGCPW